MNLTSENVNKIFCDCLFREEEDKTNYVEVEGVMFRVGFHPERLASYKEDVKTMLQCLPDSFIRGKGIGCSFLEACNDKNGVQWTDFHQRMEQLFMLGIGLELAAWLFPRPVWVALAGGMPHVIVF